MLEQGLWEQGAWGLQVLALMQMLRLEAWGLELG